MNYIRIFGILLVLVVTSTAKAQDTFVDGYYRNDGAYVQPHYRSAPNNNPYDNYSIQGNINPYTGVVGQQKPPSFGYDGGENSFKPQTYPQHRQNSRTYGSSYDRPQSGM